MTRLLFVVAVVLVVLFGGGEVAWADNGDAPAPSTEAGGVSVVAGGGLLWSPRIGQDSEAGYMVLAGVDVTVPLPWRGLHLWLGASFGVASAGFTKDPSMTSSAADDTSSVGFFAAASAGLKVRTQGPVYFEGGAALMLAGLSMESHVIDGTTMAESEVSRTGVGVGGMAMASIGFDIGDFRLAIEAVATGLAGAGIQHSCFGVGGRIMLGASL